MSNQINLYFDYELNSKFYDINFTPTGISYYDAFNSFREEFCLIDNNYKTFPYDNYGTMQGNFLTVTDSNFVNYNLHVPPVCYIDHLEIYPRYGSYFEITSYNPTPDESYNIGVNLGSIVNGSLFEQYANNTLVIKIRYSYRLLRIKNYYSDINLLTTYVITINKQDENGNYSECLKESGYATLSANKHFNFITSIDSFDFTFELSDLQSSLVSLDYWEVRFDDVNSSIERTIENNSSITKDEVYIMDTDYYAHEFIIVSPSLSELLINKVQCNNETLLDLTGDTVTTDKLLSGYTAHDASGSLITGTYAPSLIYEISSYSIYNAKNLNVGASTKTLVDTIEMPKNSYDSKSSGTFITLLTIGSSSQSIYGIVYFYTSDDKTNWKLNNSVVVYMNTTADNFLVLKNTRYLQIKINSNNVAFGLDSISIKRRGIVYLGQ